MVTERLALEHVITVINQLKIIKRSQLGGRYMAEQRRKRWCGTPRAMIQSEFQLLNYRQPQLIWLLVSSALLYAYLSVWWKGSKQQIYLLFFLKKHFARQRLLFRNWELPLNTPDYRTQTSWWSVIVSHTLGQTTNAVCKKYRGFLLTTFLHVTIIHILFRGHKRNQ